MNISPMSQISLKANDTRRLIPLSEYKGPKLDLMFYEQEEINILKRVLSELENEARDVIRTTDTNKYLTGYQKNKCRYKLFDIETSITVIKDKIYKIKKERYSKQMAEYLKLAK